MVSIRVCCHCDNVTVCPTDQQLLSLAQNLRGAPWVTARRQLCLMVPELPSKGELATLRHLSLLNKAEYVQMHISTLDPLKKTNCPIFMFAYFTKLFSRLKQEVNSSGHVTLYSKHATLHIFHGDSLISAGIDALMDHFYSLGNVTF